MFGPWTSLPPGLGQHSLAELRASSLSSLQPVHHAGHGPGAGGGGPAGGGGAITNTRLARPFCSVSVGTPPSDPSTTVDVSDGLCSSQSSDRCAWTGSGSGSSSSGSHTIDMHGTAGALGIIPAEPLSLTRDATVAPTRAGAVYPAPEQFVVSRQQSGSPQQIWRNCSTS